MSSQAEIKNGTCKRDLRRKNLKALEKFEKT